LATKSAPSAKKILLYSFIAICFVFLLVLLYTNANQLTNTRQELASTQNTLTSTQADLAVTEANLAITETELSQTQSKLTTTQADLSDTQNELKTTNQQLEDTSSQLTQAQADYTKSLKSLDTEKALSAELQSSLDNLQVNYDSLTTGVGYLVKDPTYQEMKAFLAVDTTDSFAYVTDEFVCHDFAAQVSYNARLKNIRCAYVLIDFLDPNVVGHAIVAFKTTDRGLVYVESQTDEEVRLAVGTHYWSTVITKNGLPYLPPDYDDTVEDIFCLW
jgi:hypothetical protein